MLIFFDIANPFLGSMKPGFYPLRLLNAFPMNCSAS